MIIPSGTIGGYCRDIIIYFGAVVSESWDVLNYNVKINITPDGAGVMKASCSLRIAKSGSDAYSISTVKTLDGANNVIYILSNQI